MMRSFDHSPETRAAFQTPSPMDFHNDWTLSPVLSSSSFTTPSSAGQGRYIVPTRVPGYPGT
eukprot:1959363-Rhodomonas_salina.1